MTATRWQRVKHLFGAVLALDPEQRGDYLARVGQDDPDVAREVGSLVASHEQADGLFMATGDSVPPQDSGDAVGQQIGPYRLEAVLGRGGMGVVYLGVRDDGQYDNRVAIKLIRPGMDGGEMAQRFRTERQILARLDHPNIARLLDGGTLQGRPYLVMDYVQGVRIDRYVREQGLDVAARLELCRAVCSAVQHAHRNLIIHRDLKPGNILVTDDGVPKLLDFGVAKLLDPGSAGETTTGLRAMTPEYASPEQVCGEPLTTSTDVYSLGVLLYELLTGRPPYRLRNRTLDQAIAVIRFQEPDKPSTAVGHTEEPDEEGTLLGHGSTRAMRMGGASAEKLRRTLAGDLDTIVLTALHKDPARRYASVEQLSEDLRRYLLGLPVMARRDTFGYRARKFVRRHTAAVTASGFVLLSLVAGIAGTSWQASVAREQRARADRRFNDVRRAAQTLLFDVDDAIRDLPGSTPARQVVVGKALEYLDDLAEVSDEPSLLGELATAYLKVGDVQGHPEKPNLGDLSGALESYGKALVLRLRLNADHPDDAGGQVDLAESLGRMGMALAKQGHFEQALRHQHEALRLADNALERTPADPRARTELSSAHSNLAELLSREGKLPEALDHHSRAIELAETLLDSHPEGVEARTTLAAAHAARARSQERNAASAAAVEDQRVALDLLEAVARADPGNATARRQVASARRTMGYVLFGMGNFSESLDQLRKALASFQRLADRDPHNAETRRDVAICHLFIGQTLQFQGDSDDAVESSREAVRQIEALAIADPTNAFLKRDLVQAFTYLGDALSDAGASSEALEALGKAVHAAESRMQVERSFEARINLVHAYNRTGVALTNNGDLPAAVEHFRKALGVLGDFPSERANDAHFLSVLASSHGSLARVLLGQDELPAAREHFDKAHSVFTILVERDTSKTDPFIELLAWVQRALGRVHTRLAERATGAEAAELWRLARSWYKKSLDTFRDLQSRRALAKWALEMPKYAARDLARCDAELKKLAMTPGPQ